MERTPTAFRARLRSSRFPQRMAEGSDPLKTGERLGPYEVQGLLGVGATSKVYLGRHIKLGRLAAIKVLGGAHMADQKSVERLLKEARLVNDIRHPSIVDIFDVVEVTSPVPRVALVMEHVPGPSLKKLPRRPSLIQSLGLIWQLADALEAAHRVGVIHRDLKPDNLLLMGELSLQPHRVPELKIIDFGVAKAAAGALGRQPATSIMIGTPAYMAPEQVAGQPPPSAKTDVYGVSEVFFELLTGQRAFPSLGGVEAMVRMKLRQPPPALEVPRELSPGLQAWIQGALASRQEDRPDLATLKSLIQKMMPPRVVFEGERSFVRWLQQVQALESLRGLDDEPTHETTAPGDPMTPDRSPGTGPTTAAVPEVRTADPGNEPTTRMPVEVWGRAEPERPSMDPNPADEPSVGATALAFAAPAALPSSLREGPTEPEGAPSRLQQFSLVLLSFTAATLAGVAVAVRMQSEPSSGPPAPSDPPPQISAPRRAPAPRVQTRTVRVDSRPPNQEVRDAASNQLLGRTPLEVPIGRSRNLRVGPTEGPAQEIVVTPEQRVWTVQMPQSL